MIKLAICDDDIKELNKSKNMCNTFKDLHSEYDIKIYAFNSSAELLNCVREKEQFDIYLLDIYMPGMMGTELARFLREGNDELQVIFLTTSLSHAVEAFSLHAAHYLVKPFHQDQLDDALIRAILTLEKMKKTQIILKTSGGLQKLVFGDLLYSETEGHVQKLYLMDKSSLKVRISCSELYEMLSCDRRFYKCGCTYIINLEKIKEVTAQYILFENGTQIPMQRRQYKELLERYTRYSLEDY